MGTFEVRPSPDNASHTAAQSTTSGGLLVALCDGSVRIISVNVSGATFYAALTPSNGDPLGNDW